MPMTSKANKKVPQLRFPEYSTDWKDTRFGDLIHERKEFPKKELPLYSLTIENGVVPKAERYERSFLVKSIKDAYKVMRQNDFAFNPMNLRFGALARHKGRDEVTVSKYYNIFCCNENAIPAFMETYLKQERMIRFYDRMSTGTLEEKKRVHYLDFVNFVKPIPVLDEQKRIAGFLEVLDDLLLNLRQQKEKLEEYKLGVVQKIFSQKIKFKDKNGEDFPEWEKVKLGQIFSECSERAENKNYDLLSVTLKRGVIKYDTSSKRDNSSKDKTNYKVVRVGDIAYNTMRMWQGASGVSNHEGIVSPAYTVVRPIDGDSDFFAFLFKTPRTIFDFYRYSQGLTSDTWNLKFNHFSEIEVIVPTSIEEQKRIKEYLSSLDKLIRLKNEQIDTASVWKKGLIQKMFV